MSKFVITGGTGFIGANFVHSLLSAGEEVYLLVRKESKFWRVEAIKEKLNIFTVDLLDNIELIRIFKKIKPDIVLHFAAYGAYQGWQQEIKQTIETNILGAINLMNAAMEVGARGFINTGSSSEYGIKNKPLEEKDIPEPTNLYGVTKVAATLYGQMLAKEKNFPVVTVRPFSPYGPFEEKKRLIPTVILSFLKNTELNLSRPSSVRDFIYIDDLIGGYLEIIKNVETLKGEIINIGTGIQHSVEEVISAVKEIVGHEVKVNYGKFPVYQHEPDMWVADISKAKRILQWEPTFSLKRGLEADVNWFRKNLDLY